LLTSLLMELDDAASESPRNRLSSDQNARIRSVAIRMAENPPRSHPVAELARKAGYSRNHFTVLFQRYTGHTPERYAVLCRLRRASQLLAATELDVGEIAAQLGYSDIYGFSHQFKKFKGVSPLAWRRRHAGTGSASDLFAHP
jgi:transcriptional regulator GlxA family with amidase domain